MRIADRLIDRRLGRVNEVLETQPSEIVTHLYNISATEAESVLKKAGYLTVEAGDKFEFGEVRVYQSTSNGALGEPPYIYVGIEDKVVTVVSTSGVALDSPEAIKGNVRKVRRAIEAN